MKNYSITCPVQAFIMIVLTLSITVIARGQDLTEAQKKERCQTNKNRIAELETELRTITAELSQTMEKKEIEDARDKIVFLRKLKTKRINYLEISLKEEINRDRIAAQYNWSFSACERETGYGEYSYTNCLSDLESMIAKKIDKAVSLQNKRPELINKKNIINNQLDAHRNNLIALGCNESSITQADDFDYSKISGTWQSLWGPVTLSVSKSSVSGSWKQSAEATGQITGGSFDAKTTTLKFTYSQAWNKKTGKVTLRFSETATEYSLSGSWSHDDGTGSGSWGMNRGK